MTSPQIERVDAIPILVTWLQHMVVAEHIGSHWTPHREWDGLRFGGPSKTHTLTAHSKRSLVKAPQPYWGAFCVKIIISLQVLFIQLQGSPAIVSAYQILI
jgi:hypothetical protein